MFYDEVIFVIAVLWAFVIISSWLFSKYLYSVYSTSTTRLDRIFGRVENLIYRIAGVNPYEDMGWKSYFTALLMLNMLEAAITFLILTFQGVLPLNPMHYPGLSWSLSFNTAISFATNTNLQHYAGGASLSYFSQMAGLIFLQFTSAATGIAVAVAVFRGFAGRTKGLGNFYVDYVRTIVRVLLPVSFIASIALVGLGIPQTLSGYVFVHTLQAGATEVLQVGPIASLVSIMQLGTNGGGYFGANAANPFMNPSQITDFLEIGLMMLIPTSILFLFGRMIHNRKEGRTLFLASYGLYTINLILAFATISSLGAGMETRFGSVASVFWAVTTTGFTTGSVNASLTAFSPLVILSGLFGMLEQSSPGGAGVGATYMLIYVVMTVFIVGLMAGRTPEYLGAKITAREVKLAIGAFLVHPVAVMIPVAVTFALGEQNAVGLGGLPLSSSFTRVFWEFASAAANNGSDFLGSSANNVYFNLSTGVVMFFGRYVAIAVILAIAGGMLGRNRSSNPALRTDGLVFTGILIVTVFVLAVLAFFPFLALGPLLSYFGGA